MGKLNKAMIIGRLGRDPEVRYTQGGQAVANFSIATDERWTDKSGEKNERTEWHKIVAWGRQAELAGEYLKKGRQVYVEGRLQTREYEDKEGIRRWSTEVVAQELQFLDSRGAGAQQDVVSASAVAQPASEPASEPAPAEDDIPF